MGLFLSFGAGQKLAFQLFEALQVDLGPVLRLRPAPPEAKANREGFPRRIGWAQVWNPEGRPQMKPVKLTLQA